MVNPGKRHFRTAKPPSPWQRTDRSPIPRGPFGFSFPPGNGKHQWNLCSENGRYPIDIHYINAFFMADYDDEAWDLRLLPEFSDKPILFGWCISQSSTVLVLNHETRSNSYSEISLPITATTWCQILRTIPGSHPNNLFYLFTRNLEEPPKNIHDISMRPTIWHMKQVVFDLSETRNQKHPRCPSLLLQPFIMCWGPIMDSISNKNLVAHEHLPSASREGSHYTSTGT